MFGSKIFPVSVYDTPLTGMLDQIVQNIADLYCDVNISSTELAHIIFNFPKWSRKSALPPHTLNEVCKTLPSSTIHCSTLRLCYTPLAVCN